MADLVAEDLSETIVEGFKRVDLIRTYQVFHNTRTRGAFAARNESPIPRRGAKVVTTEGDVLYVTRVHARRVETDKTEKKWHVDVTMTNATGEFPRDENGRPVENPEDAVKDVDITYLELSEEITDAKLRAITYGGPLGADGAQVLTIPPFLRDQRKTRGPVTNSAGVPQEAQKPVFKRLITVSQWVNSWTDLDSYIGKINSDEITIQQRDKQGAKLSIVAPAETLLLQNIIKEDYWKDGILYFRRRFVLAENKQTWRHASLDQGTKRYIAVGQFKPDGTRYTQADLDSRDIETSYGYEEIVTKTKDGTEVALGQPIKFNGWGSNQPIDSAQTYDDAVSHFMNYDVLDRVPFAPLNL